MMKIIWLFLSTPMVLGLAPFTDSTICLSGQQTGILKQLYATFKPQMGKSFLPRHHSIINSKENISCNNNNILKKIHHHLMPGKSNIIDLVHTSTVLSYVHNLKNTKVQENVTLNVKSKSLAKKKPLKQRIMEELKHYYHGFKLFCMNVNITTKLTIKRFRGYQLTRREHRLLNRTLGDIFKLVPFSVFVVVPFMEFTLPIFLKLFPGMLPSTFQTESEKEMKAVKHFKVKLEMTKFLQETLEGISPLSGNEELTQQAKEFSDFFSKVRTSGHMPSSEEIIRYSKLFEDEITLDKLGRPQIIALCRVLDITPFGTTRFLIYQLKLKLKNLHIDDKIIQKEGINSLSPSELQDACRVRGMRSIGFSEDRLKEQLQQWLDLSLIKNIPPSLLLLSQAFQLSASPSEKSLAATIQALPSEVGTATRAVLSERGGSIDYETEISMIKDELLKIKEETVEAHREEIKQRKEHFMVQTPSDSDYGGLKDTKKKLELEEDIKKDLSALEEALGYNLFIEKGCLAELKHDLQQYEEHVKALKEMMSKLRQTDVIVETLAARRLHKKLVKMMKKLEDIINSLEQREYKVLGAPITFKYDSSPDAIKIEELLEAIKKRNSGKFISPKGKHRLSKILHKLDHDKDGIVKISNVSKLLNLLEDDELAINSKKIDELINLISKEETLAMSQQNPAVLRKRKEKKVTL